MNPDWLLNHFNEISETPDAVPRLRRFILDLAVRGKLVEQDPADKPVSELLKRIEAEKRRLADTKDIKIQNRLPMPKEDVVDFRLPIGWKLVPLGEVAVCLDYRRVPINNEERVKRIEGKSPNELFPYYGATQQQGWIDDFIFDEELVLLGEDGVPFYEPLRPKAYVISGKTWVNNHAHVFRGILTSNRFLAHWLNVFDYSGRVAGATRSKLNQSKAIDIPTPLPPLAEQNRIVAKVDELMALCDELEAAQQKRERRRDRLVAATLHGLNNGDASSEVSTRPFEESARFYFNHLPRLTTRPEHIQQLRQTILNLAVRGKLVRKNPMDESVHNLIERIAQNKQAMTQNGRLKRRVPSEDSSDDSVVFRGPHSIPEHWRWVSLSGLITFGPQNGVSPKPTSDKKAPKALTLTATTSAYLNAAHYKHIELNEAACESYWLFPGDVLFQRGNTREYVGIAAVFDGPERSFVFPDLMIRVRFSESLALRYIHTALISPPLRCYFSKEASGASSSMPKISQGVLLNALIPLPPVAEQQRIVGKVDKLMALCDELESRLHTITTTRRQLLEATLREAMAS